MTIKHLTILLVLPLLMSGCGDKTPDRIMTLLEGNEFSEASTLAKQALENRPKDPFYHGVMAEVLTEKCVRGNCPAANPDMLDKIRQHLSYVEKPISLPDGRTFNTYARLAPIAERFISVHGATKSYAAYVERALPKDANKRQFLREIEGFAQQAMQQGDFDAATSLLKNVVTLGNPEAPTVILSKFILAFIRSDGSPSAALQAEVLEALESSPKEEQAFVQNIPHLALIRARRQAENTEKMFNVFRRILTSPFSEMGLKSLETPENKKELAHEIRILSQDETYLNQFIPADMAEKSTEEIKVALMKVALLHDPANADIWTRFFPLALERVTTENDSLRFVYNNIDLADIPADVVIKNNELLLEQARKSMRENRDITPYLQEIIYRRDAEQERFDAQARTLLEQALDRALAQKNYQQAVNYLRLMPDPPKEKREELKPVLQQAIGEFWEENAFQRMEEITQYMRNNLNAPINLDVELMDLLREYLDSAAVKKQLRAVTPERLLLPAEEARIDLGPKIDYARRRFSNRPEVIQARLKALAINLEGAYSTANILHSLRHLFTDPNIDELITNSLKAALVNDETLSAVDMAIYGEQFMEKWPDFFTINFVVDESLKRVENVRDAQQVWGETSQKFHDFAAKLRPQLVNLLEGIRLFESGNREEAAPIFARITDPVYRQEAQPYLETYTSLIAPFKGSYFYQGKSNESPVAMLFVKEGKELLQTEVTALSHLGVMEREQDLIKDRGKVARITFTGMYDTRQNILKPRNMDDVISGKTSNEARTFGQVSHLRPSGDTLYLHLQGGEALPFVKMNQNPGFTPLPKGTYGITENIHITEPESHVLPKGSILNFNTERQTIRQDIEDPILDVVLTKSVHPVSGTVRHPASAEEIPLTGFFERENNLIHFEYAYSFDGSETIFNAAVRCQPLGARITCAGHNKHEKRKRFLTVVGGRKAE